MSETLDEKEEMTIEEIENRVAEIKKEVEEKQQEARRLLEIKRKLTPPVYTAYGATALVIIIALISGLSLRLELIETISLSVIITLIVFGGIAMLLYIVFGFWRINVDYKLGILNLDIGQLNFYGSLYLIFLDGKKKNKKDKKKIVID